MSVIYIRDKEGKFIPLPTVKGADYILTEEDKQDVAEIVEQEINLDTKLDKPTTDGTAGQVLTLADDGTTQWTTPSGGSSGGNTGEDDNISGDDGDSSANADTSPEIAQTGVTYQAISTNIPIISSREGMCITKPYSFSPVKEKAIELGYYKADTDVWNSTAYMPRIKYYIPNAKYLENGYSDSSISRYSKIVIFVDENIVMGMSNTSYSTNAEATLIIGSTSKTNTGNANNIAFSLFEDDGDDSYAYWTNMGNEAVLLPDGIRNGDIIFAGKNTPYYGMANIDGTMASSGTSTANELSYDDDIAMNYSIATTSILGEENAADTQTAYGLSSEFATVIDTVRKNWITEYGGDYRKIPIIVSTDQHGRTNSGIFNMLGKVLNMHDVSKVMNLGDTTSTWYDADISKPLLTNNTLDKWLNSIKAIPYSKRLDVFGNHDTWYGNYEDEGNVIGTRYPSSQAHLNQYFRNIYARRTNNNGWFVDYDNQFNVKYVVISGFEYQNNSVAFRIGTAQMNFIIEEFSKNDGYDIVVISHVPIFEQLSTNFYPTGDTTDAYTEQITRVSTIDTDVLFNARKNKTSGTVTDSDGVEHSFDFSNCNTDVLCALHGHEHEDQYNYVAAAENGLLSACFDWFDDNTFFFVLIDRVNNQLNVWKVEAPDDVPTYQNYQIPFNKTNIS